MTRCAFGAKWVGFGARGSAAVGRRPVRDAGLGQLGEHRGQGERAEAAGRHPEGLAPRGPIVGGSRLHGRALLDQSMKTNSLLANSVRAKADQLKRVCSPTGIPSARAVDGTVRGRSARPRARRRGARRHRHLVGQADADVLVRPRREEPAGESLGLLVDERVVHEEQRLGRHRRDGPLRGAGVRVGPVEEGEERVTADALGHQVDAPPGRRIDGAERGMLGERRADRRERVGSAGRAIEAAAEHQDRVADRLGLEPAAGEPPEQLVGGIGLGRTARRDRSRADTSTRA